MNNKLINDNENVKATIGYGYLKSIIGEASTKSAVDFVASELNDDTFSAMLCLSI